MAVRSELVHWPWRYGYCVEFLARCFGSVPGMVC